MTTIKLKLLGGRAEASVDGILTAGTVGLTARCSFDEAWDGLIPRLAVRCGGVERAAVIDGDGTAVIPWECLLGGEELYLSVDGWEENGVLRLPSVWVNCGRVAFSAVDCAPEEPEPTPEMQQQIYVLAKKAADEAAQLRQDFEAWKTEDGSGEAPDLTGYATEQYVQQEIGKISIPEKLSELTGDTTHRTVTDAEKSTWNGKQAAIADLETIRSGAAAGRTALQASDIDDGLTNAGKAADAKATGDALNVLGNAFRNWFDQAVTLLGMNDLASETALLGGDDNGL